VSEYRGKKHGITEIIGSRRDFDLDRDLVTGDGSNFGPRGQESWPPLGNLEPASGVDSHRQIVDKARSAEGSRRSGEDQGRVAIAGVT
jgi:hypothetical protein